MRQGRDSRSLRPLQAPPVRCPRRSTRMLRALARCSPTSHSRQGHAVRVSRRDCYLRTKSRGGATARARSRTATDLSMKHLPCTGQRFQHRRRPLSVSIERRTMSTVIRCSIGTADGSIPEWTTAHTDGHRGTDDGHGRGLKIKMDTRLRGDDNQPRKRWPILTLPGGPAKNEERRR